MLSDRRRFRPSCDPLESRLAMSNAPAAASAEVSSGAVGDLNGDGQVEYADLRAMAKAYLTKVGDPRFNPADDLNHDGKVNQIDARILGKLLPKPAPGTRLTLALHLAPGQQFRHPGTYNSGAITRLGKVTILGKTIPGSLVFADSSQGLYKFDGPLLPTDARGRFTYTLRLKDKLTATDSFLVIDPFGHQLVRNYPILRVS